MPRGDLTKVQRKEYIDAVLCLQSKPPLTAHQAPGAKSRFDDYVVVHVQQTHRNHGSVRCPPPMLPRRSTDAPQTFFLPWHRYYIWHYENALRTECGYTGYQPYWNWGRYANDPENSPLFNGDEFSLSGNGKEEPHAAVILGPAFTGLNRIPIGTGGGCVTTGPFAKYVPPKLHPHPRHPKLTTPPA